MFYLHVRHVLSTCILGVHTILRHFKIRTRRCLQQSCSPSLICKSAHVLYTLFVFFGVLWSPTHLVLCFCIVCLRLVCSMLSIPLDCPFLTSPSVFSNVYLSVSLDCPFLAAPSVFSNV